MTYRPVFAARSGIRSSIIVVSVASATEVTNRVPPNVEPCVFRARTLATSSRAIVLTPGTHGSRRVAELAQPGQVAVVRDVDTPLALERLDQDGRGAAVHGPLHGAEIVVGHVLETGQHGLEAVLVLLLPGGAHGAG